MTENSKYRVLITDQDQRMNTIYKEKLGSENVELNIESSLEDADETEYDTVITDFVGQETYDILDNWNDVIVYTANDPGIIGVPEERYVQKGSGLQGVKEMLHERVSLHKRMKR